MLRQRQLGFFPAAIIVIAVLALPSAASAEAVQGVDGIAVVVVTSKSVPGGWLMVSSLAGDAKGLLTPPVTAGERRYDYNPSWSPDGGRVAFARQTPSELAVMVVNADGSDLHSVAVFHTSKAAASIGGAGDQILWSPDRAKVAFVLTRGAAAAIYVASSASSGAQQQVAATPRKPSGYVSLFGWSRDSTQVTYSFTEGEVGAHWYTGPSRLRTVSADGSGRMTILVGDAIADASWAADGSLIYVRHCVRRPCQLAERRLGAAHSRALTHFKFRSVPRGFSWDSDWDQLAFLSRPGSSDIVYEHSRKVYEFAPSSGTTRRIGTLPCTLRHCSPWDAVSLLGITQDGRFALFEYDNLRGSDRRHLRDYTVDLETGARAGLRLVTSDPAAIFLG